MENPWTDIITKIRDGQLRSGSSERTAQVKIEAKLSLFTKKKRKRKGPVAQANKKRLKGYAKGMKRYPTSSERKARCFLRRFLKKKNVQCQHPIMGRYILDFYIKSARLAIEIDGGYHETKMQQRMDTKRDLVLSRIGITTWRFSDNDVLSGRFENDFKQRFESLPWNQQRKNLRPHKIIESRIIERRLIFR